MTSDGAVIGRGDHRSRCCRATTATGGRWAEARQLAAAPTPLRRPRRHRAEGRRRGVLLFLFLPIFVIVLFSFNKPAGQVQLHLAGLHARQLAEPVQVPAAHRGADQLSLKVAAVSTAIAIVLGTLLAIALVRQRFRGQRGRRHLPGAPADRARGGDGRVAADAVPRPRLDRGLRHDRDRPRRVPAQLRRADGARPGARLRLDHSRTRPWTWAPARPGRSSG